MSMKPGHTTKPAGHLDDRRAVGRQVAPDTGNAIAVDQHVEDAVEPVGGIDHPAAL